MDFAQIRTENDQKLTPVIDSVRNGEAIEKLAPFAKAYLGMYYVINNDVPPLQRLELLLNEAARNAVLEGFIAVLHKADYPSPREIGAMYAKHESYDMGYVILAALDYALNVCGKPFDSFSEKLQAAAVCFHFTNQSNLQDSWIESVLSHDDRIMMSAMNEFWNALLNEGAGVLPGNRVILGENRNASLTEKTIVSLLQNWSGCRKRELLKLFYLGLKYGDHQQLLGIAREKIAEDRFRDEPSRVYWHSTRFVLEPERAAVEFATFIGRAKIKVLPFLDYVTGLVSRDENIGIELSPATIASILSIVGPIFPPQYHIYGDLGELDVNSRNVMWLFYLLSTSTAEQATQALKKLKKTRVMKIYKDVIDHGIEMNMRLRNSEKAEPPLFEDYVRTLIDEEKLSSRSNRYDSN